VTNRLSHGTAFSIIITADRKALSNARGDMEVSSKSNGNNISGYRKYLYVKNVHRAQNTVVPTSKSALATG
jgi:hypothetical protein